MPVLKVFFFGLICHVGKDNDRKQADHAAFIDAPGHTPKYALFDPVTREPVSETIPANAVIRFKVGGAAPREQAVPFDQTFRRQVLRLGDIIATDGKVKADVQDRTNTSDVAAYIVYPPEAEKLGVADLYNQIGRHHYVGGGVRREGCLARITMMEVTAGEPITIVGLQRELRFTGDDCILFTNGEPRGSLLRVKDAESSKEKLDKPEDCHTFFYSNIATKPVDVICEDVMNVKCPQIVSVPRDCGWVGTYIETYRAKASEFIECGNTQWP